MDKEFIWNYLAERLLLGELYERVAAAGSAASVATIRRAFNPNWPSTRATDFIFKIGEQFVLEIQQQAEITA